MQAGAFGSFNDKTIVRYSDEVHTVRTDPFYTEFKYEVRTGPSAEDRSMESGAFGINDGGYHKWAATQAADKTDTGPSYAEWRKQMESVRKDIECFFGRFKSRFRMFKTPLTFHDKGDIDNAFFTCVALQNILPEWDKTQGFFTTWEVDAAWLHFDDEDGTTEDGMFWCRPKLQRTKRAGGGTFVPSATEDFSSFGALGTAHNSPVLQSSLMNPPPVGEAARYQAKQRALVTHFEHARAAGAVHWLR